MACVHYPSMLAGVVVLATAASRIFAAPPETWEPIGPNAGTVFSLARDPVDDQRFYAGTYFGGLYRSDDAGTSWQHVASPFPNGVVFSIALDPFTPEKLFCGTLLA